MKAYASETSKDCAVGGHDIYNKAADQLNSSGRGIVFVLLLIAVIFVFLGLFVWIENSPVADSDIVDASKESNCINEGIRLKLKGEDVLSHGDLSVIRNSCNEAMRNQAEADARRLTLQRQRSALDSASQRKS